MTLGATQRRIIEQMIRNGGVICSNDVAATEGRALSRLRRRGVVWVVYDPPERVARWIEATSVRVLDPARAAEYVRSRPRGFEWWILNPDS